MANLGNSGDRIKSPINPVNNIKQINSASRINQNSGSNEQQPMNLSGENLFNDEDLPIDNPDEMVEEEEDFDDDPEILEEIDIRHEEIVEQFMELSLICKHEAQELLKGREDLTEDQIQA
jgi:hypothetical protein